MSKFLRILESIFFVLIAILMILPLAYMTLYSFQESYSPFLFSLDLSKYTLKNYINLFSMKSVAFWIRNSFFISIVGVLWTLVSCILAAYAFVKKKFRGKDIIYYLFVMSMSIPFTATVVPQWLIFGKIGWINTFWPLILPIPNFLAVLLIRQAINNIPKSLFESAQIDGISDFKILVKVVIPLIKPIIITISIIFFARSWNSFLWPLIISNTDLTKTLPVGLAGLVGTHTVNYGMVMAGSTISFMPPLIVYILLQKYYINGIAFTGLKG